MSHHIQVCDLASLNAAAWDTFVRKHAAAEHYHLSGWGRVIHRTYRHQPLYFSTWQQEKLTGVMPVIVMGGVFGGQKLVSLPFLDYGGICAEQPEVAQRLCTAALEELGRRRARILDLRQRRETQIPLYRYSDKVTMILNLERDAESTWDNFESKVRNQIRKAEKGSLIAQWTGKEGLNDFYDVYTLNMRDLGSPPHSLKFFHCMMTEFPDARILLIRLREKVIGAGLCLVFRETMLVPWASSLRSYFHLCPNNLLYWEAIRKACTEKLRRFDFGRSSRDTGTYKFKKQWGAVEEPLHWQSNVPGGDLLVDSGGRLLELAVQVWSRLPVGVTRHLGPIIRRRISN